MRLNLQNWLGSGLLGCALLLAGCQKPNEDSEGAANTERAQLQPEPAAALNQELFGQGETIAETVCAQCHAIRGEGSSPHVDAPPFRELGERYPIEMLAESLVEGIMVGHSDMPEFQFDPQSADSLIVYINSLQPKN